MRLRAALYRARADKGAGEAFAAKHLSDMGEETEDFTVFKWPLKEYRRMEKKALSPSFTCGGHKWSVRTHLATLAR